MNFKELLTSARENNFAIGAFNIFNYISARSAITAANKLETPTILQTSVGTAKKFGISEIYEMIDLLRKNSSVPVLLHLDHCTDPDFAKKCIDAGWDSVMIDMSAKPLEENIKITADVKQYAAKKGVCVEGELGIISGVEDELSSSTEVLAEYDNCIRFIRETGIDALAPAVGTAHGMYTKEVNLNYDLIQKLAESTTTPIVIHGGTGLSDYQFQQVIKLGASKINVSTALKYAFVDGVKAYLQENPKEYNPLKLDAAAEKSLQKVVEEHIMRFKPAFNLVK